MGRPERSLPTAERSRDVQPDPADEQASARRLIELLNEVRVAIPGVQILFAFLLILPFTARFGSVRGIERTVYAVALVASAIASILFMSVAAEHRLRWRRGDKADIVEVSSVATVWGLASLAVGVCGAIEVALTEVFGASLGWTVAALIMGAFAWFWFVLPLLRRGRNR